MRGWASFLLLAVLAAGCASPATPDPVPAGPVGDAQDGGSDRTNRFLLDGLRPPGGTVSEGAEPTILVDRLGRAIWIGDTSGLSISFNNGTTWEEGAYPFLLSADGWPLAQDDEGVLYLATTNLPWVDVATSTDLGRSATVVGRFVDAAPIADRPWIAARGDGEVALVFYAFGRVADEACARSTDGGRTWLDRQPFAGSPNPGNLLFDGEGTLHFVDGGGDVWSLPGGCGLASNLSYNSPPFGIFGGHELGANQMLQIAVDGGDALYSSAAGAGNREILLAGSRDRGTPRVIGVSPSQLASNTFPVLSTWRDEVAVAWYGSETAGDPSVIGYDGEFNVFVARVRDFWGTPQVTYYRLTDEPNHVGDICMGGIGCSEEADRDLLDYFGVDHDPWGGIHVAYGHDGSGSDAVVRYARVPPGFPGTTLDLPAPTVSVPEAPEVVDDGQTPAARFTHREEGLKVRVDAGGSTDPNGDALTFSWNWGDGASGSGREAQHTYARSGAYTITLRAADSTGKVGSAQQGVIVDGGSSNRAPEVRLRVEPERPVASQDIKFIDASTDADGTIVARAWQVDGELAGTGRELTVRLPAGPHTLSLRVTDDDGASSTGAARLTVGTAGSPGSVDSDGGSASGVTIKVPAASAPWAALALAAAALAFKARRR